MKNTAIVFLIIFCLLSCSDRNDEVIEYQFEILNQSGKNIEIISYDHDFSDVASKTINIKKNGVYREKFLSRYSEEAYFFFDVFEGDSIVVNYAEEKQQIYYCYRNYNDNVGDDGCDEPRNILAVFHDADDDPNNNIFLNQYIFTEEDYKNATPCNGECE